MDFNLAFLYNIQGAQLLIILLVILILFGSKRLPEFAKGLGKALHEFKKAANDLQSDAPHPSSESQPHSLLPQQPLQQQPYAQQALPQNSNGNQNYVAAGTHSYPIQNQSQQPNPALNQPSHGSTFQNSSTQQPQNNPQGHS